MKHIRLQDTLVQSTAENECNQLASEAEYTHSEMKAELFQATELN